MRTTDDIAVVALTEDDWPAAGAIYAAGIATGHASFETGPPGWMAFDATYLPEHRLVARNSEGRVLGWAAASPVSERCVYIGVAEVSVYVDLDAEGRGIGTQLLGALIESTEETGIWTLQAGIFPENKRSLVLHEALGFRVVGVRERLGKMTHGPLAGEWRDVVLLERRSHHAGR